MSVKGVVTDAIKVASICRVAKPGLMTLDEWIADEVTASLRHSRRVMSADDFLTAHGEYLDELIAAGRPEAAELVASRSL